MSVPVCSNCRYLYRAAVISGHAIFSCVQWGGRPKTRKAAMAYGCSRFQSAAKRKGSKAGEMT